MAFWRILGYIEPQNVEKRWEEDHKAKSSHEGLLLKSKQEPDNKHQLSQGPYYIIYQELSLRPRILGSYYIPYQESTLKPSTIQIVFKLINQITYSGDLRKDGIKKITWFIAIDTH